MYFKTNSVFLVLKSLVILQNAFAMHPNVGLDEVSNFYVE